MPAPSKLGACLLVVLSGHGEPGPTPARSHVVSHALVQPATVARLRDGDLVFRAGRDFVSNLVLQQHEASRYSHVGVFVWHEGQPCVVHAVPADELGPGGVRLDRLEQFAGSEAASRVGLSRLRALSVESAETLARRSELRKYALAQLGKPFDDAFVYSDDAELYCTELALKVLQRAGIDVREVPRAVLPLHAEGIPLPDDLSLWSELAPLEAE